MLAVALASFGCDAPESAERPGTNSTTSHSAPLPVFTEVTATAGLGDFRHENGAYGKWWFPEQMGSGCGFIDYDGDDWLDILLVGGGALVEGTVADTPALWLYRNNGDGTFTLKTEEAGLGSIQAPGTGVAVADYDNDGDDDFFFTTVYETMLFRNDAGVFTEVTKAAGLVEPRIWSSSAIFLDADKDGWLDLYVGHYADWTTDIDVWCSLDGKTKVYCPPSAYEGVPSSFFHNNGDGTFTNVSESAGFTVAGKSLGMAELDFNRDGWSDFVVSNDGDGDFLYENNHDGTFSEVGMMRGLAYGENGEARAGMGIDAGVVDQTGCVSVFIGHFSAEMVGVYRYSDSGWFVDRSAVSKIGHSTLLNLTFGLFLMDVDFDGDLDLFLANGHVYPMRSRFLEGITYKQAAKFFLNDGSATFEAVDQSIGGVFNVPMVARGAAYGDYDRDGDPDILITENGGPAHLWRNDFKNPHFLRVRLEGRQSNRDAIGSRIVAVVGKQRMERRIRTGSSYLSDSEKVATFGLGPATSVDSLFIYWPSGLANTFTAVSSNQEILLVEGENRFRQMSLVAPKQVATADLP